MDLGNSISLLDHGNFVEGSNTIKSLIEAIWKVGIITTNRIRHVIRRQSSISPRAANVTLSNVTQSRLTEMSVNEQLPLVCFETIANVPMNIILVCRPNYVTCMYRCQNILNDKPLRVRCTIPKMNY